MNPATIDTSRLKAAVDAVKDRDRPEIHRLRLAQQAKLAKLRRGLGKQIRPLFTGASFDAGKIDKALAQHQAEMRDALQKEKADAAKHHATAASSRLSGIANTRQALEHIQLQPYVTTPMPLMTPYMIYATPVGMIHDSHVEPWNSWAKFTYSNDQETDNGSAVLNFYFTWHNRSDYLAVLNCSTALLINGIIEATGDTGWFTSGAASLNLDAILTVFVGQTTINWQPMQRIRMGSVYAEGGQSPIGSGGIQSENIVGAYNLACNDIQVPAGEFVVFEVACSATWWIQEGGSIVLDFDFDPGAYKVMCPVLQADLLTQPSGPIETIAVV
jgi:hypothetical protein